MRRALTAALITATSLAAAAPALASEQAESDARGDTMGHPSGSRANVDIVTAGAGDAKHGKIAQTVTFAGNAGDPHHGGLVPLLYINVPSYAGYAIECDFYVGREEGRDGVYECATKKRVGKAKITRKGSGTLRYVFSPKSIGKPKVYEWAFAVLGNGTDGTYEYFDRAPDTQSEMFTYRR
jgi:hypothetical protein